MQSNAARAGVLVILIAAAAALFVVLKGNDDSSSDTTSTGRTAEPLVIEVDKEAKPVGGVQELTVSKGGRIRFDVRSAIADEVHLHGYDVSKDVKAGGSVSFDVPATLEGEFEAELEQRHAQILALTVEP